MPFDSALPNSNRTDMDVLLSVRLAIAKRGAWCKGTIQTRPTTFCAIGWLLHFIEESHGHEIHWERCDRIIASSMASILDLEQKHRPFWQRDTPHRVLAQFNDNMSTTQSDIVALFDSAIAKMETQHAV